MTEIELVPEGESSALATADVQRAARRGGEASLAYLARLNTAASRTSQRWALERAVALLARPVADGGAGLSPLGNEPLCFPWQQLDPLALGALRHELAEAYVFSTANRILTAVRGVLGACWRMELLDRERYERLVDIPSIRGSRDATGRVVTPRELAAMRDATQDTPDGKPRSETAVARDTAVIALLAGMGLRRAEISALDLSWYERGPETTLRIRGKGNKERLLTVPAWVAETVDAWLVRRGNGPGPLFLPLKRNGETASLMRRLSTSTVATIPRNLATTAGIERHLTTHDLRRTFVSNLLSAGVDLAVAQRLAGHAQLRTTARYDKRGQDAERAAVDKLKSPLGNGSG